MKQVAEGGCGVVGFASTEKLSGKHLLVPCAQMHNRGNGKGGGVVAVGLSAEQLGVPEDVLKTHYLLQVAYLEDDVREKVEKDFVDAIYEVESRHEVKSATDYVSVGLEVEPPRVWRYFVRPRKDKLEEFMKKSALAGVRAEDEYVHRMSYQLNQKHYSSLGQKQAFVLSHGKDMMVYKIVGYAEQAIKYYGLEDTLANIWMGHQRYPTKGVVWHPGGAHPFIGLNSALVHNGDFANYHAIAEYLRQHGRELLFLTDTEAAAQLFDLYSRSFEYPLEYVIESLAPTTERDFLLLPKEKQDIYQRIQETHLPYSPDGPWFFIIAQNNASDESLQLIGITDTSMLRPQVFALAENQGAKIGLIASEKQAIDAALQSINSEDSRFLPVADKYWNARGGSYTDGGSFAFTVKAGELTCENKFGQRIEYGKGEDYVREDPEPYEFKPDITYLKESVAKMSYPQFEGMLESALEYSQKDEKRLKAALNTLTALTDQRYPLGGKKRSALLSLLKEYISSVLDEIGEGMRSYARISSPGERIPKPPSEKATLAVDTSQYAAEGEKGPARVIPEAYRLGWRNFIFYNMRGQRFIGCGVGAHEDKVTIDVYGSCGDYAASGIENMEVRVHANAQDQLGQIMRDGKLVIYGDVGQTLLYGAKGGECYVLGSAAGRPMINAVGKVKAIINGTCLDYLAESFMAGDPLKGGGFAIVNGVEADDEGKIRELETPYPGGNLFSLSSGGAIYVRDPHMKLDDNQLNGGQYEPLTPDDWTLIEPYLKENERLFGISVEELLTVEGKLRYPEEVYRKVTVQEEAAK